MTQKKNDTVGIHYELPNGKIAYTVGFNNIKKTVSYYFDDDSGGHEVSFDDFYTWTPRTDLRDFPNARDPRLPYEFDLYWDIKYVSQLKRALTRHADESEIRECMKKYSISF